MHSECYCLFLDLQVVFEGIRGSGYEGDIAIDDVSITIGKCKQDNTVASAGKTGKICTVDCRHNRGNRPHICRSFEVPGEMNIYKYPRFRDRSD